MPRRTPESLPEVGQEVLILEAQVRAYFANMQAIYNASTNTGENPEGFLSKAANINTLRTEYLNLVKQLNIARLQEDTNYEPNFQSLIAFEELFSAVQYRMNELSPSSSNSPRSPAKFQTPVQSKSRIKLPAINLQKFDGNARDWTAFYECYNNIIHYNKDLSNTEKLQYLLGQISGTAQTAIAGIEPTGDNYQLIYSTLEDKYQDVRNLGCFYLDQIYNFKPLINSQNLNSFLDTCATSIAAFEKLKIKDKTDFIYLYLSLKKIDQETARLYESSIRSEKLPSFENFITFIKEQAKINERIPSSSYTNVTDNRPRMRRIPVLKEMPPRTKSFVTSDTYECPLCNNKHHNHFYQCSEFLKLTPRDRYAAIKANNACTACLSVYHTKVSCNSSKSCNFCNSQVHHSLLCFSHKPGTDNASTYKIDKNKATSARDIVETQNHTAAAVSLCSIEKTRQTTRTSVLLATACVRTLNKSGIEFTLRCLIDNASQHNFITNECATRLNLDINQPTYPMSVDGFGGNSSKIKGVTHLTIFSKFNSNNSYTFNSLIVDKITHQLPTSHIDKSSITHLTGVPLADETYYLPGRIDMILGAQMFTQIIRTGRIYSPPGAPQAFETTLGFILMGEAPISQSSYNSQIQIFCAITNERLDSSLRKFFEVEEIPKPKNKFLSPEEQECEEIYKNTTQRDSQGRYIVALPFKSDPNMLGDASQHALTRFRILERKLELSPNLRTEYNSIFQEYIEQNYLAPIKHKSDIQYVIPHLCVRREDKVSSKIRLVLDASSKSVENNISLNQLLHKGPNLQSDLFIVLLNFRLFKIAISADIKQMYLQLKVHPEFWKFQRIFYRFAKTEPLQLFEFNRVCFGLSCSPFLALRTLKKLAEDEGRNYPLAKKIIDEGQYYMDDVLYTTHTVGEAINLADQLSSMLSLGGFKLLKWSSNSSLFLQNYPKEILHPSILDPKTINFSTAAGQKVLGIEWEPAHDTFTFNFTPNELKCTKRNMLSIIAQLFDVLGLIAPVILYAKLLIKELWLQKIDWDDDPPHQITQSWSRFQSELSCLSQLSIPRHIGITDSCEISLVAFADASEKAYGAVLYIHTKTPTTTTVKLLCAKSKVAPVKIITLAKLELCAAYLLSKLVSVVLSSYCSRITVKRIYAFSDSTITLNWINTSPHKLKTFVANRVSKIQTNVKPENFFHIAGKENPSDCLSRGLTPAQLISHPLWFSGPSWLQSDCNEWPIKPFAPTLENLPEVKLIALPAVTEKQPLINTIAQRTSNWNKLLRIFTYLLRFSKRINTSGSITADDLNTSEMFIVRVLQQTYFSEYINAIKNNHAIPRLLNKLRPILINGILRVGGRISASSEISFDHKHPVLLPRKDHIVNLIIDHVHSMSCHAGPQLTLSLLRKKYWILSARTVVRARIHACIPCFKTRPKPCQTPLMADLPTCRLDISKAFSNTGIDYCGPFYTTLARGRGIKSQKAYVCIFICLTTRAVHVEVAPDLTTHSFLNAWKRFVSRRGHVNSVRTDQGSNFKGAKAYLSELYEFLNSEYDEAFKKELANSRISWVMNPPNAPHFGGSWESAVKSFKTHLLRVIGNQILTYEELLTVLCQIEAVLNSRPLGLLSEDPAEPSPITPAHFLNTTPLKLLPAADVLSEKSSLLSRFSLLDKLVQSYWKRWRDEYLHTLQVREKWNTESRPIQINTVVLIMQDNAPPLHWPLGIIEKLYTGIDGRSHVALVKTKNGTFKRPVMRLCPLPIQY
ncbi:uncharacterized protein LOC128199256 [Bicyclus anynana]|uniref:Uncharacterized protein LOC128199256 n=1 Tax=Bicyclus anynana TaxID=110368 RepID=A0ABM3LY40_BICAN|nr:uncharacterized protein LOC128199256 [Bicyclus anynana]